ncbi:transcriptional regulator [Clostridium baratii]|uniref:helix-turn-helix domain-containing protein n=1 Tax=Clostridium baratii TaxID=1561 RepID=UPI0006C0C5DA|nr:helix-turn-helix transcriptional regulator [Clostridium baratii]CUO90880.1 transcriptional regulator [Clostridium baratii]
MNVSTTLKKLRKENKLTLKDLSKKSGISVSFISDIENMRRNPSIETLEALAIALNVSINTFFDNKPGELKKTSSIEKDFPIVPKQFVNPNEARDYVMKHQIFAYGGINPTKMSDEDILNLANEMLNQAELLSLKYSLKNK